MLHYTGLDWTGLDWTGQDWTGLDWTGLDWTGLDWTGLDWLDWTRSNWIWLDYIRLDLSFFPGITWYFISDLKLLLQWKKYYQFPTLVIIISPCVNCQILYHVNDFYNNWLHDWFWMDNVGETIIKPSITCMLIYCTKVSVKTIWQTEITKKFQWTATYVSHNINTNVLFNLCV